MNLLLLPRKVLGHKHGGQHLITYTGVYSLISAMLALAIFPAPSLAFEAGLSNSSSQALKAPVRLAAARNGNVPLHSQQLPEYSYRSSGTVTAHGPVITTAGDWRRQRLVRATPSVQTGPLVLEGEASYYSRSGCLGCGPSLTMANGGPLDDKALTMAIGADKKHLVGRTATVTNLATGQAADILITDTGGFHQERYGRRVADLTVAAKQAIGMVGGVEQVRVEVY
jgi:rare lipoprotein A (peptidoglycan hydrolase)